MYKSLHGLTLPYFSDLLAHVHHKGTTITRHQLVGGFQHEQEENNGEEKGRAFS